MPDKESYIHLRVPAATKGRWVRESRAAGMRLTDWITQKIENDMNYEKSISNMQKYGGSFVMQLARLWLVADQGNRDKLEAAFGDIFDKYENI